jgi:sugar O-acyltransferase (sialic acid O-acetyltransferase NeuD family)
MKKILIIGAGGHAQVVADILMCSAHISPASAVPIGYLDSNSDIIGHSYLGLPVLGCPDEISQIEHDYVIVAIGNNHIRQKIFNSLAAANEKFITAIHPSAIVAASAVIGVGTVVCAGVIVNPAVSIGDNVILNTGATIDHHNEISNHVHIAPGVNLGGTVTVGEGAFIGLGANVIPQLQIGDWSIVGAGTTLITDVESHAKYVGVPGKRLVNPYFKNNTLSDWKVKVNA